MAAMAVMACVREEPMATESRMLTIEASIPADEDAPGTKAGFSVPSEGTGLHLAWQAGDKIRVINHANPSQNATYDIQPGFDDHHAKFSGTEVSGSTFDIVAPGSYASVAEAAKGNAALTQDGNGSTSHLVFTAALENVSKADLPNITFSDAWVAEHSGTSLKKGGIVKFVLTLPDAVKTPKKVVLTGIGDKEISVNIENVDLTSAHVLTAYAQSGWEDVEIPAWTKFTVGVLDESGDFYAADKTITTSGKSLKAGAQNSFNIPDGFTERLFAGGNGSKASPYLIASAKQLNNMHVNGVLKHQEMVYFRLIDDIDMQSFLASTRWIPLNSVNPYDYQIDFDGAGHTIRNFTCSYDVNSDDTSTQKDPSFFGVLYGNCYDVTFADAAITCNSGPCGILGGYVGYTGKKAVVSNVHLSGSVTKTTGGAAGTAGVGAMAGLIVLADIESCSSTAAVTNTNGDFTGGLIGRDSDDSSRIRNCWTSGEVYGNQKLGGIIGGLIRYESQVINCFSTSNINATRFAGGIIGDACLDAGSSNHYKDAATLEPGNVVKGCIAWQTLLKTRDQGGVKDGWGSGAIIGLTALKNTLIGCKRNSALVLDDFSDELILYDQNDASPSTPLVVTNPRPATYLHYNPYHGKAFSGTISDAARACGWDQTVWDLSGDIPVLTGAVEAEAPAETPVSGDAEVPAGTNIDREFPEDGTDNWTVEDIDSGIRYYHYRGTCSFSWMDSGTRFQEVFVIDYDLTNTDFDVKLVYTSPGVVCSKVFESTGAVAAINAGYEKGSIALKANALWDDTNSRYTVYPTGYPVCYMPNNTIGTTGVRNWKSEGTFYTDGHQNVRIAFDGYAGGCTDNNGTGTTVKTIQQERAFYRECTDGENAFLSSAPVLIANYTLFGRTFRDRNPRLSSESEEAYTHQGGTYPRTAVALAYPDGSTPHLLLIVCDGRYDDGTNHGYGMSALWLTRFIANYFGPKYMLNLDGGGSTTMCVQGQGDEDTHVVNYPCDNYTEGGKMNHAGERERDSFIVIVPKDI